MRPGRGRRGANGRFGGANGLTPDRRERHDRPQGMAMGSDPEPIPALFINFAAYRARPRSDL